MDVIYINEVVNILLGIMYLLATAGFARLIHHLGQATPEQYAIILSKKSYLLGIFYAVAITCLTVSYQNFFNDFSQILLWWRLCLISSITSATWKWSELAKTIRKVANNGYS